MKKIFVIFLALFAFTAVQAKDKFTVETVTGKKLEFQGTKNGVITKPYEGKVVFVEFWGTWCAPCLLSIPHHEALQEKYKDQLRIIAFETTPSVTREELKKYINNPKKYIDMSKVDWFLANKAKSPQAKAYFQKPIQELEEFKKSNKKITYDVVASQDGKEFVSYIASRAGWRGSIPFLVVFDKKGNVIDIIAGMPDFKRLEADIQKGLQAK
jgi:thiol-disulfide isomerase/thioredoxin